MKECVQGTLVPQCRATACAAGQRLPASLPALEPAWRCRLSSSSADFPLKFCQAATRESLKDRKTSRGLAASCLPFLCALSDSPSCWRQQWSSPRHPLPSCPRQQPGTAPGEAESGCRDLSPGPRVQFCGKSLLPLSVHLPTVYILSHSDPICLLIYLDTGDGTHGGPAMKVFFFFVLSFKWTQYLHFSFLWC